LSLPKDLQAQKDCLAKLAAGVDAWPQFWDLFGGIIETEVYRFFGNDTHMLDDIYQELVLRLLAGNRRAIRRHLTIRSRDDFGGFVRMTARNLLIDAWRRRKRRGELQLLDNDAMLPGRNNSSANPAQQVLSEMQVLELLYGVAGRRRESTTFKILVLRFVAGESVSYIAEQMQMKENTVRHRIHYYMKKLSREQRETLAEMRDE